jgi:hypothetical protein
MTLVHEIAPEDKAEGLISDMKRLQTWAYADPQKKKSVKDE